jgi:Helix-turn-helix domain
MQKAHQWEIAGEAAWGVALHREAVIRPLAEQPRLSAESITEAANKLGLSRSILYKLLQRYRRRPQTSYLRRCRAIAQATATPICPYKVGSRTKQETSC